MPCGLSVHKPYQAHGSVSVTLQPTLTQLTCAGKTNEPWANYPVARVYFLLDDVDKYLNTRKPNTGFGDVEGCAARGA